MGCDGPGGGDRVSLPKVIHLAVRPIMTRFAALLCLALLGLSLGGCTKCGWLWNDQGPGTCHSDNPR
jgi:hypothetical protein